MRKEVTLEDTEKKEEEVLLTEQEVWDIIKFATALGGGNIYGNALTPMLLNERMKEISLNPARATEALLDDALLDPKNSEQTLQSFSQDFEIISQPYKRLLGYLSNLLSFDLTYECINVKEEDYSKSTYRNDLDRVKEFFDRFDYRKEFAIAVSEMLRNEAFFCAPRFDFEQYVLQELPSSPNYTMITGRWDYGMLFSFNMYWFIQPGVDVDLYPDFFMKKYGEFWDRNKRRKYDPSVPVESRGLSSWVYWLDIPVDVGFMFKLNPAMAVRVPYFTGLFQDLVQQPVMRALQKNANMSTANRLILGEVGQLKEAQSKTKDQFNISPGLLGSFLALVKSAIGEAMKTAALPLANVQGISFPGETDLYSTYLKTAMATSGVNTNLIFTQDQKLTTTEAQLSVDTDIQLMTALYPQFEGFLNYHVNRFTKRYKFRFHFEGSHFFNNRQQRYDKALGLASLGIVLPQKIAASLGMSPFEFQRQIEEAKASGFVEKLTPIVSGYQQSGEAGRPKKADSDLTEEGDQTRSSGGNVGRGGKIN